MKPWIIAALICSVVCAAYAAEDDNKIHPTCVEENNTSRCLVDHGPPTGVRPPQLQPVAPAPRAAIPPPAPAMGPFPPPPRLWPPPLIFRFGPNGLTEQTKQLVEHAQKAVLATAEPLKMGVTKAFNHVT